MPVADKNAFPLDTEVSIQAIRDLAETVSNRVNEIPDDPADVKGRVMVVATDGRLGIVPADPNNPGDFNSAGVSNYIVPQVEYSGTALALNTRDHSGRLIIITNSSAVSVTASGSTDPGLGVTDGFVCTVLRRGTGDVTPVAAGGLTLRNPDSHTKAGPQWSRFMLSRVDNDLIFDGRTAA